MGRPRGGSSVLRLGGAEDRALRIRAMSGRAERSCQAVAVTDRNAAEGEEAGLVELAALVQKEQVTGTL